MQRNYLDKLMYLVVLAEEKNITRAAERLFLSQPALTAYLNRLEDDLGVKLFDRTVSPIQITPAGTFYISEMEKLHNQQNRIFDDLKHMDYAPETSLRIGIGRNRGSLWLPYLLPAIYEKYPEAHLQIFEDRDENMIERALHGQLDVIIIESFYHSGGLVYHPLPDEYRTIICSPNQPGLDQYDLRGNTRFNPLDVSSAFLNGQIFICPSVKGGLNYYTQQLFTTYRITPKEILFFSNLSTAYQLAVKGVGVSYLAVDYADTTTTQERPIFLMPGGKPSIRKLYCVYAKKNMTDLKKTFIQTTADIMTRVQAQRFAIAKQEARDSYRK